MALYLCKTCGGDLVKDQDGLLKCTYCGNTQTVDELNNQIQQPNDKISAVAIENVYKSAMEAMANQKYDDAIRLFSNIHSYLDVDVKLEHCQKMMIERNNSEIYNSACITLANAKTAENYKSAARIFNQILGYKDASSLMNKCLSTAELLQNEELYAKACEMMNEDNIHFWQRAADIFGSILTFKDSANKQKECLALIEKQRDEIFQKNVVMQHAKSKAVKKKKIIFFIVIISIVLFIFVGVSIRKANHSIDSIDISIVDVWSKNDSRYYYVYTDYKITNKTAKTIDYIEVVTYVTDQNGKSLGTITSSFGSTYGNNTLNLKTHKSTIQEKYLSGYQSDSFFVTLYNNGIQDLIVTHEIVCVKWSDGYTYDK